MAKLSLDQALQAMATTRMLDGDGDGEPRVDIGADEYNAWTRCVGVIAPPLRPEP